MAAAPTPRELDDYREQADRFIAAIDEEYYLHYAGHKPSLDLAPIYERFAELTSLEQAGLLVPIEGGDEPRYPADDLDAIAAGMKLIAAGIPLGSLLELGKEHAANIDRTARQAVDLFDHHVRERIQAEGGETEAAERKLLALFTELLEASGTLVRHHFERTLLRAAREHIEKRS